MQRTFRGLVLSAAAACLVMPAIAAPGAQAAEKPIAARQESVNVVILVSIVFCTFMSAVRSRRPAGSLY